MSMKRSRGYRAMMMTGLLGVAGAIGCSSGDSGAGPAVTGNLGTVGVDLQIAPGIALGTVSYSIAGNGYQKSGSINVQNSSVVDAIIGGIPVGTGFTLTLSATDSSAAGLTCSGSAEFNVVAGSTTSVRISLTCSAPKKTGSIAVNGTVNVCPSVDGLSVSPSETTVGQSVSLIATASDLDQGPSPLSYAWSSTGGSLTNATSASPTFTCTTVGVATVQVTVSDGVCSDSASATISCDAETDAGVGAGGAPGTGGASSAGGASSGGAPAALSFSLDSGATVDAVKINQGTAIGEGSLNGATPFLLTNLAADPKNTETITSATNPFGSVGNVPDTAFGFCDYSGATPKRITHVTGAKFETTAPGTTGADPMVTMAPFYFPLVFDTVNTPTDNAFGGKPPIIGLFDWRPKDIDEALVAAESDDNGKTWFFMQSVLELFPDYTNPISGGYSSTATATGCPPAVTGSNASSTSANGSSADDGWGHAAILQLPGAGNIKTGQFLYMLDRNPSNVDVAPLFVINLAGSSNKFPLWNTNNTSPGNNDIKSISTALNNSPGTAGTANAVTVQQTTGLLNPDGIMAVFPTSPTAAAGSPVTILYVQKILDGDDTGSTALPAAEQCTKAPFSGKTNHDISNVRIATTTDGVNFVDGGIVSGLNDPTTVDYTKTRWISPRATLIDVNGDGSLWGMLFSGGNCLDGDSDAFHYIGYAESTDRMHWTVYSDIMNPIASINTITTKNQAGGAMVTVPSGMPLIPTQPWFAQRLYAPTATQIDSTHLSMTFAGYGVQTPANDLLNYRQIGNVALTVSKELAAGVPNNINTH